MNICPNCHHQEYPGALFCSDCGAQLVVPAGMEDTLPIPLEKNHFRENRSQTQAKKTDILDRSSKRQNISISLHLLDSGHMLVLEDGNEFTLGRMIDDQPVIPEVDLRPFGGYEKGVSRLHAVIGIDDHEVTITDLGSGNGTRINDDVINPHMAYPLHHGDMVTLGTLRIRAVIQEAQ